MTLPNPEIRTFFSFNFTTKHFSTVFLYYRQQIKDCRFLSFASNKHHIFQLLSLRSDVIVWSDFVDKYAIRPLCLSFEAFAQILYNIRNESIRIKTALVMFWQKSELVTPSDLVLRFQCFFFFFQFSFSMIEQFLLCLDNILSAV